MRRPIVSPRHRRHVPLFVEPMEPRRLLATLNGNVLEIAGTASADTITVARSGTDLVVTTNGTAQTFAASSVTSISATLGDGNDSLLINDTVTTPASILGGAGDDTLRGGTGTDTIDGGDGSDTVTYAGRAAALTAEVTMSVSSSEVDGHGTGGTGSEGDTYSFVETIVGGNGDDSITLWGNGFVTSGTPPTLRAEGGAGDDQFTINSGFTSGGALVMVVDGGDGNDGFDFGGNRDPSLDVSLYGGAGDDSFGSGTDDGYYGFIDGGSGTDALSFRSSIPRTYTIPAGVENFTFYGTQSVTVNGNDLDNVITMGSASSSVYSATVSGGAGNDTIHVYAIIGTSLSGGAGDDTIIGGLGDDTIDGGDGNDTVSYAGRTDAIAASLRVEYSPPTVQFGPYIANLSGTGGSTGESDVFADVETIVGGSGNDTLSLHAEEVDSSSAAEQVSLRAVGGAGNDRISVTHSYVAGGTGNVALYGDGGADDDTLSYDGYGNVLTGGDGDDRFENGSDDSSASIDPGAGDDHWVIKSVLGGNVTMPAGLERITVNASNVNVVGNDLDNVISVNGGTVNGGAGNDTITVDATGSSGFYAASIVGGAGNDSIVSGPGDDTIEGGAGNDTVNAGAGNDVVRGDAGDDSIMGDDGDDALNGGDGDDFVGGGNGNDNLAGGNGDDQLAGDAGNDSVRGDAGNDRVAGNAGSDRLKGGTGNDTLLGQNGRDFLQGDTGADYLIGGGGNDVLSVNAGSDGVDTLSGNGGYDEAYADVSALLSSIAVFHPH